MGEPGTVDAHWRELVFDNELMTGFINFGTNPLSGVTVSSLADWVSGEPARSRPLFLPAPSSSEPVRAGQPYPREGRPETADWRRGDQR